VSATADLAHRLRAHPGVARIQGSLHDVPGAFLVGGAVRDLLREAVPRDLDVVVEGDAAAAAGVAAARLGGAAVAHERFNTASVEAGDLCFDIAGARRETYRDPGALPEVEPAPLREDLERRDFTVNAMAAALADADLGTLHAAPRALEDLDAQLLRVLHERSFVDDPTRLLRLVRYAARLGFGLEAQTRSLAEQAARGGALDTVSGARVGAELRLTLAEKAAGEAIGLAAELGVWAGLGPGLDAGSQLTGEALAHLPPGGREHLVRLAVACRQIPRADLRAWLADLEYTAGERDAVLAAALDAPELAGRLRSAGQSSEIAALARGRPPEALAVAAALGAEAAVACWESELRAVRLEITGEDLLAAGVPEGPAIGEGLAAALRARLDGAAAGRESQLAVALRAAGLPPPG